MTRPFDPSKFRKSITKSIDGISHGFHDPSIWIHTGNYALNYIVSGDFKRGVPMGKVTVLAGESGCLPETAKIDVLLKPQGTYCSVTVGELNQLYHSGKHTIEINTPDGYQPLGQWFNKGTLPMVRVYTPNHETVCATNHLIQLEDNSWVPASELDADAKIQTVSGVEPVLGVIEEDHAECYDFEVLHPNHRYYGDGIVSHNSGKSFIASGNLVRNAQKQGIFVVLLDSENALDEKWLQAVGVDTCESKLLRISVSMIDDVAKIVNDFVKEYKSDYGHLESQERPKVLFVVDSLGMLLTPTDVDQFQKGDMKGDMGRKAKALTALVRNCVNLIAQWEIGMVLTNHTYASQDPYNPDDKISGGCLTADHGVVMQDGSVKAIQNIQVGDQVQTLNEVATVAKTFVYDNKPVFELELDGHEPVTATAEHKFLTIDLDEKTMVWRQVQDLVPGNLLMRAYDGNLHPVKYLNQTSQGTQKVYDISVPGPTHYILEHGIVSHNSGAIYASSIVVAMKKLKLKEDEEGNKVTQVLGIRSGCKVMKSRYSKPFESIEVQIPYETGMNEYSGLFELFEKKELLSKQGNRYVYVDLNNQEHKYFRKEWKKNQDGICDLVMSEFEEKLNNTNTNNLEELDLNERDDNTGTVE